MLPYVAPTIGSESQNRLQQGNGVMQELGQNRNIYPPPTERQDEPRMYAQVETRTQVQEEPRKFLSSICGQGFWSFECWIISVLLRRSLVYHTLFQERNTYGDPLLHWSRLFFRFLISPFLLTVHELAIQTIDSPFEEGAIQPSQGNSKMIISTEFLSVAFIQAVLLDPALLPHLVHVMLAKGLRKSFKIEFLVLL